MEMTEVLRSSLKRKGLKRLKKLQKTQKKMEEIDRIVQDMKMEIKRTQTEGILGVKILRIQTGTTEASFTKRIQEMEERSSSVEDRIEEMDTSVKENAKSRKILTQNI